MDRYFQWLMLAAASLVLAACGTLRSSVVIEPTAGAAQRPTTAAATTVARTPIPGGMYTVLKGDTLYSIAFRNGVDFRDLAQWNQIAEPYTIWPGQRLRLSPGTHVPVATAGQPRQAAAASATASAPPAAHSAPAAAPMFETVAPAGSAPTPAGSALAPPAAAHVDGHAAGSTSTAAPPVTAASAGVVPVAGVPPSAPAPVPAAPAAVPTGPSRAVGGLTWRWPAAGAVVKRFQSADAIPGIEIAGKPGEPVRAAADGVVVYSGNGLVGYGELVIIKHSDSMLSAYGHNRKRLVKEGQHVSAGQQIAEMGATGAARNGLEFQIRKDGNPIDPLTYLPPR
ncbi:MAG TPA: peptidoglycan DD-metalloendopeptidase family protein [Rhodanobacter sp.]|nr:peptidoglycan DD-metalloendopeptidase family protein [Rhodanobacter sp.]